MIKHSSKTEQLFGEEVSHRFHILNNHTESLGLLMAVNINREVRWSSPDPSSRQSLLQLPISVARVFASLFFRVKTVYHSISRQGCSGYSLCITSSRYQVLYHHWSSHRLHGRALLGEFGSKSNNSVIIGKRKSIGNKSYLCYDYYSRSLSFLLSAPETFGRKRSQIYLLSLLSTECGSTTVFPWEDCLLLWWKHQIQSWYR
jgi:hypothetical protein